MRDGSLVDGSITFPTTAMFSHCTINLGDVKVLYTCTMTLQARCVGGQHRTSNSSHIFMQLEHDPTLTILNVLLIQLILIILRHHRQIPYLKSAIL